MKLSKVATISAGHPFRGRIPEKSGSGIRAVQMKDVSAEEGIFWSTVIETELSGKKQPDWLRRGDILFAARGSRNYAVLIDQEYSQIVAAPHFYILRVKGQSLLPEFLAWQLNQKPLQSYFDKASEGTLTKSVRRPFLENACITVPPIERQKQILGLYNAMLHEKALYSELIRNGERLMNSIAIGLTADKSYS